MRPVAIIQHLEDDGPAFFGTWLAQQGIAFTVYRMHADSALPTDIHAHSGLCILGGAMSANDPLPYFPRLLTLIQQAVATDIPVIGHCLGGQLMSQALGGSVQAAEHAEIGWSELQSDTEAATPWFGAQMPLRLFQWHSESFSIPPGATRLLRGVLCANQAFVVHDRHLAMQFHCEVDAAKLLEWLADGEDAMRSMRGPGVQSVAAIRASLQQELEQSQAIAARIYQRWALGLTR
jgi:GMP synthase-like glutamine amidotransferase